MIGLVTLEARLAEAEARALIAETAEKRRKDREQGGTPLHAAAEGHQEHLDEEREQRAEKDRHDVRHPATGQFTTASAWPATDAHAENTGGARVLRVGDPTAPEPAQQVTLSDRFSADHGERFAHQGTATLQHLDLAGRYPLPVATTPVQPVSQIAPNSPGGTS